MRLAERDDAMEALLSDRSDEPLGIGVEIGTLWRQPNRLDTAARQDLAEDPGSSGCFDRWGIRRVRVVIVGQASAASL